MVARCTLEPETFFGGVWFLFRTFSRGKKILVSIEEKGRHEPGHILLVTISPDVIRCLPDEVWIHIHDYAHGPALTHVCRYNWKLLGHRRRILPMVGWGNGPHRLATLPEKLEQLIVPILDDAGMEYLQNFYMPFPSLVMPPGSGFLLKWALHGTPDP